MSSGTPSQSSQARAAALVALGAGHLLRLDAGTAELVDFVSASVLRFDGELARALAGFAAGRPAGAALEALGRDIAGLGEALASVPEPLDAARALARGGFDTLFLELTGACNERCVHCYAGSGPEVHVALDEATCAGILDDAARIGFRRVQLTGGDPLLCRFLPELVRRGVARGLEIEIYTNGLALGDALLDELSPDRPSFAFSLYSHDAGTHDAITRTPGSHARTLDAVGRVRSRGLGVRVGMIVMEANAGHVGATRTLVEQLGVESFGWSPMRAAGRGGFFAGAVADAAPAGHRPAGADRRRGTLCVLASGDVVPCVFDREDVLGSVRETALADLVAEPGLATPRLEIREHRSSEHGSSEHRSSEHRSSEQLLEDCHRSLQCLGCRRTAFVLRAMAGA